MSKISDTQVLKALLDEEDRKKGAKPTQPLPPDATQQDDTQAIAKAAKNIPNKQISQQKLAKRAQAANASGTTPQQAPDDDEDETDLSGAELRARYRFSKEVDADRKAAEDEAAGIDNASGAELRARARFNKDLENDKTLAARRNIARITRITQTAGNAVNPLIDRVAAAKTPGGIGALVVILIILLVVLMQVNVTGDTRLKQLWYMLGGEASLRGRVSVVGNQPNHNGGGDFNTPFDPNAPNKQTPLSSPTGGNINNILNNSPFRDLTNLGF